MLFLSKIKNYFNRNKPMHLRLEEPEIRQAVAEYLSRTYGYDIPIEEIEPVIKTYGEYDCTEKIMEGYKVEIKPKNKKET